MIYLFFRVNRKKNLVEKQNSPNKLIYQLKKKYKYAFIFKAQNVKSQRINLVNRFQKVFP